MASNEQIGGAILLGLLSFSEAEELVASYATQIQDESRRRAFLRDFKKAVETGQGALVRLADHLHIKPRDTVEIEKVITQVVPIPVLDTGVILNMAEYIRDLENIERAQEEEREEKAAGAKTIPRMTAPAAQMLARLDLHHKGTIYER
jgi:hypothetical protein